MHLTPTSPSDDLHLGLCRDPAREVMIREEEHPLRAQSPTTWRALEDVQQTSDSAFTATEVFTYVTTGTPG